MFPKFSFKCMGYYCMQLHFTLLWILWFSSRFILFSLFCVDYLIISFFFLAFFLNVFLNRKSYHCTFCFYLVTHTKIRYVCMCMTVCMSRGILFFMKVPQQFKKARSNNAIRTASRIRGEERCQDQGEISEWKV